MDYKMLFIRAIKSGCLWQCALSWIYADYGHGNQPQTGYYIYSGLYPVVFPVAGFVSKKNR